VVAAVATLILAGCGSASRTTTHAAKASPLATVCTAGGRSAVAGFLRAAPASVASAASMSSQAAPQCVYRARGPGVRVTVIVDTSPQPYFRLERAAVEAQQVFSTVREAPAPVQIPHLGLDADWFPQDQQIMTTDGRALITAGVVWRHSKAAERRALAETAARAYLGAPQRKAAHGYPSG
jgi:hypothetical protein